MSGSSQITPWGQLGPFSVEMAAGGGGASRIVRAQGGGGGGAVPGEQAHTSKELPNNCLFFY